MRRWIALGSAIAFAALAVCVDRGSVDTFDSMVRGLARPHDVWGPAQIRADLVVEGLRPTVMAGLLAVFAVACCIKRRSMRPATFVGVVCLSSAMVAVAVKLAVRRTDPHGLLALDGGSFPSGHMIGVIVCSGMIVLLTLPRAGRWRWLIPALVGGLMAASLVLQAAHWSTDVVGGALLASGALALASAPRCLAWLHSSAHSDHRAAALAASTASSLGADPAGEKTPGGIKRTTLFGGPRLLRSWPGKTS
jgi:membrane-associated phospholipid phosphatase